MKIVKVNASFSMKKSLGNYEMADIFFAAEAEVIGKENPEEVAQKVHDFCKKLAVEKYNSFSKPGVSMVTAEEQYFNGSADPTIGTFPKVYKPKPGEIEKIVNRKVEYIPREKMTMEYIKKAHKEMVELNSDLTPY